MHEDEFNLDLQRSQRIGFDEAILCEGKAPEHLIAIVESVKNQSLLLTRLNQDVFNCMPIHIQECIDYDPLSQIGFYGSITPATDRASIAIVTAGTSDLRASKEAARTLLYHGIASTEINDIGVAGLWRLLDRIEELRAYKVIIVAAGLDAALPSVIGGLVPGLIIALPTSTGYGVARNGETALFSSLVSCAPGIVVVNIDNGYGAACASIRALQLGEKD